MDKTLTGREFKLKVLGSGLKMRRVYESAGVSSASVDNFVNGNGDITLSTYNKLIAAYEELKPKDGKL